MQAGIETAAESAQTDLGKDALAGEELGAEADHEAKHGETAVPGLGEGDETEAGVGAGHWIVAKVEQTVTGCEGLRAVRGARA